MREMPKTHSQRVSLSLIGRLGTDARRWKGNKAGYVAKHLWLTKHYSKGNSCEGCGTTEASRLEWANISGEYKRERTDYMVLCPSCHRRYDKGGYCKNGHEYTIKNTYIRKQGWRACRKCLDVYRERFNAKGN